MTVKQKAVSKWVVLLFILALAIPIITDSGCCETLTIHEDGTASDCYGHYYSREQTISEVMRYQSSCFNTPEYPAKVVRFESEEAYQRFMEYVRQRIDAGWHYGHMLEILEQEHRPGSGGGTDLPSTQTEGDFGGGDGGGQGGQGGQGGGGGGGGQK
jgi:uncharacterized membrane protein YgcG